MIAETEGRSGEKYEQGFLDVVSAVEDECGGEGDEQCACDERGCRQGGSKEEGEEDERGAEKDGNDAVGDFGGVFEGVLSGEERGQKCEVIECRAVVIVGVVDVAALFEEETGLERLVRFVAVHGTLVESGESNKKCAHRNEYDERDSAIRVFKGHVDSVIQRPCRKLRLLRNG